MGIISDVLFSNKIGKLANKALDIHAQRALLINSNIANAETPGYKAADFKPFEDQLKAAYSSKIGMTRTDPRHMSGARNDLKAFKPEVEYSKDPGRIDGNNVNLDKEMTKLTENSTMYQAIITAKKKRGGMIKEAIEQVR